MQPSPIPSLADEASAWEARVKASRQRKDPTATLAVAQAAADAITKRIIIIPSQPPSPSPSPPWTPDQRAALTAVQRLTYNAAADAWPGWQLHGPHRLDTRALAAARALARRSADLVAALGLGAVQEATGLWLVGALDLALGDLEGALALFGAAAGVYRAAGAPGLVLLAEGYAAMTRGLLAEAAGGEDIEGGLERVCGEIEKGGFEDGKEWIEQLGTALKVFAKKEGS